MHEDRDYVDRVLESSKCISGARVFRDLSDFDVHQGVSRELIHLINVGLDLLARVGVAKDVDI